MEQVEELLQRQGQIATREQLTAALGRIQFDACVRRGALVRVFPRVYAWPWQADQPEVRHRAALASVGGEAALSHLSGLAAWQLPVPADHPIHITAFQPRHPRGVPDELVVHRTILPLHSRWVDEMPVVRPEIALVTSWPLLAGDAQRAPLIQAGRRKLLSPRLLTDCAERMTWIRGRRELLELCRLVLGGCHSELELWGYLHVFDTHGLRHGIRQRVIRVGSKTMRLDVAFEDERVAVELDGREFHSKPEDWERDIKRDMLLATIGWQTVRLSRARMQGELHDCQRELREVLAARRRRVS